MSNATGYNKLLGSKKEQGILTPSSPKRKNCGCWIQEGKVITMCKTHQFAIQLALMEQEQKSPEQPPTEAPKGTPWSDTTKVEEDIAVQIV